MTHPTHPAHLLARNEISSLPAGRIMDTLIHEYVFGYMPERWVNGTQRSIPCHWFEEVPRSCAEDDGGSAPADFIPRYSTCAEDMHHILEPMLKLNFSLRTCVDTLWQAGFFAARTEWSDSLWLQRKMPGSTMPEAVCRAALWALSAS